MAMGDLRALLTSHADGACDVDHPVGRRGLERLAAPLGPMLPMRRERADARLAWQQLKNKAPPKLKRGCRYRGVAIPLLDRASFFTSAPE